MDRLGRLDIEKLRRRINLSIRRGMRDPAPPIRTAQQVAVPERTAGSEGIEGEERETPMGRYLLQERVYANGSRHGDFPIDRLREASPQWIAAASNRELDPVHPSRWVFLDTETTGLAGGTGTCAFLVGVGALEDAGFRVKLYFMRDYDEEPAMLAALAEHLARYDAVVTYNGKAFDVPLLETRYLLKRQRSPFARMGHLDLLHCARRLWRERMPNCRLGTLESRILGFERNGDIPGALIPQRYFEFLRSRRASGLAPVFRHNALDIVSLACLASRTMAIYASPDEPPLRHGQDLLGLARWLRNAGDEGRALQTYRRAIRAGLPPVSLCSCLWEAAQLQRRAGNHPAKVALLRDLSRACKANRVDAFVALAKHYEHIEKDFVQALELTREAQRLGPSDELDHREARLVRKVAG